jgi:HSP20 family protein
VADVKVNKSQERKEGQDIERRRQGGLARRGEMLPSLFSMDPREFFSMSPFTLMRRFTEQMDRAFSGMGMREEDVLWAPPVEVYEREGKLVVRAELPGLNKDDVKIEATDDGLIIQGERKREHEEQREGYYRSERSYGRFYRLIPLPEGAKVDEARAQFNNGVLEVTIPAPAAERRRREIPVESEAKTRTSGGGGT